MLIRFHLRFASALVVGLSLFQPASPAHAGPRKLAIRLRGEPPSTDWNRGSSTFAYFVMDGLIEYDQKLNAVPALAQSWTISRDGRDYTFHLRHGVRWTDGKEMTAQDFIASWKRLLTPADGFEYSYFLFDIEGAQDFYHGKKDFSQVGIRAPDPYTLKVHLAKPVAKWQTRLAFFVTFPVRQDLIDRYGKDWTKPENLVTLGAFKLTSAQARQTYLLKANPTYYGKHGNLEEIKAVVVVDDATALNLYETGGLDILSDPPNPEIPKLMARPDFHWFPELSTVYLGFGAQGQPTADRALRHALAQALNRVELLKLLPGKRRLAPSFAPTELLGSRTPFTLKFDPQQAKKEYQAWLSHHGGKAPQLTLVSTNSERWLILSQWIQGQLKKNLGLEIQLQALDLKTFHQQVGSAQAHPPALYLTSWTADYADADNFESMWLSGSGNNFSKWKNADFDRHVLAARYSTRGKERRSHLAEAEKRLVSEESIIVPLYFDSTGVLVKPRVRGFTVNPFFNFDLRDTNVSQ